MINRQEIMNLINEALQNANGEWVHQQDIAAHVKKNSTNIISDRHVFRLLAGMSSINEIRFDGELRYATK